MSYTADQKRYEHLIYRHAGNSGLRLAPISIGLYQNFGGTEGFDDAKKVLLFAFDQGITHFDLANNYGHPRGSAEENFGNLLSSELRTHRDELVISTKAGFDMWEGPYGDGGSRKYLLSSLDQSLRRLRTDYVDIFYHHRPDPETPLEETILALDHAVRQGKALYVGLSNYSRKEAEAAMEIFRELRTPMVVYQPEYSLLSRWIERDGVKDYLYEQGVGIISHSPLAMGLLTGKYLNGIPENSRMTKPYAEMSSSLLRKQTQHVVAALQKIADARGQRLNQMALAWVLRDGKVLSAVIGVRTIEQLKENLKALENCRFTQEELSKIDEITKDYSLWE